MKQHDITYHSVPRETFIAIDQTINKFREPLQNYLDQLFWWNERVNLVSRDVSRETIWEHIRHSLLLTQFPVFQEGFLIVDAGTGGGLPGIPLSITSPEKRFILNDIVTKKVLSIKQMIQKLSLENASTKDASIAEIDTSSPFLLISKHAFKINDLFHLSNSLPWTSMVFYKGVDFKHELDGIEAPLSVSVHDLFEHSENFFYKDKAIVHIEKN